MITPKRILAPTDFSIITVPAVGYALSFARELGAEVTVLHALPTEVMKEQFMNQYAAGDLAAAAATPVGLTRQPDLEGIFERKKQVLHTFLEQRISSDLLRGSKGKSCHQDR
jgi:nucleotide-binding universal stress UspA family protein